MSDTKPHNFTGRREDGPFGGSLDAECVLCGIPRRAHPRYGHAIPYTVYPPNEGIVSVKIDGRYYDFDLDTAASLAGDLAHAVTQDQPTGGGSE